MKEGGRTASQQTHAPPSHTPPHPQVYVKWPDDGIWYEAIVTSHDARRGKARLDYEATSETETVTLNDLVTAKQIAFREARPVGHKRAMGELAVARGNSIAAARASDASESGGSSDDSDSDDDGGADSGGSDRAEPAAPRAAAPASRKRASGGGGGAAPKRAAAAPPPRRAPLPTFDTEAATARIVAALQTGLEMAATEGGGGGADAGAVATAVEAAAATAYGRTSKDYKTRVRSLVFNLKDPANKELRGRVLGGGIEPHDLVRLPPEALASKELAAWRAKAESDALRAAVLDEEAAAKISTAAAVDAARHAKGGGGLAETDWRDGSAAAAVTPDARAPAPAQPGDGVGGALDAGDAPAPPVSPRVAGVAAADGDGGAAPRAAVDWTALRSRVGEGGDKGGATTKPSTSAPAVDFAEFDEFDEFVAAQAAADGGGGGGGGDGDTTPRPAAVPPPPTDPPLKHTLFMTPPASGPDAGWAGDVLPGGGWECGAGRARGGRCWRRPALHPPPPFPGGPLPPGPAQAGHLLPRAGVVQDAVLDIGRGGGGEWRVWGCTVGRSGRPCLPRPRRLRPPGPGRPRTLPRAIGHAPGRQAAGCRGGGGWWAPAVGVRAGAPPPPGRPPQGRGAAARTGATPHARPGLCQDRGVGGCAGCGARRGALADTSPLRAATAAAAVRAVCADTVGSVLCAAATTGAGCCRGSALWCATAAASRRVAAAAATAAAAQPPPAAAAARGERVVREKMFCEV